ncbi:ankyrin repeat domain-containing protein 60 [Trachypithecus francoisi]|uniref:ankyrin repeat domain-containing protein 60 n=1 Tax=Trachypithecus francoisi TaxID=54180 RepID=UPI00141B3046|nr:ankyrin repeat domain-containing protein 60 [Trachypithecus francoisi]
MTRGRDWTMRRAAAGAGARAAGPLGGAPRLDPNAGSRGGMRAGAQGRGGPRAGSAGSRPLPAQSLACARGRSQRLVGDPKATSTLPDLAPDVFVLRVRLEETGELFRVANCRGDMTVRELKEELDLMVGIPFNLQRLQYLDEGVLMDDTTLKFHDVVPGGIISLCIWRHDGWTELVLAAVEGDPSKLSCLGLTEDSFYRTANSEHFEGEKWKQWTSQRAFVALYVASHRGHSVAVQYLLEHGASCLSRSPLGRTPLHVAAAMGQSDCISLLLQHGASIHDRDAKGETPISIAHRLNHTQSERQMFLLHQIAKSGIRDLNDLVVKNALQRIKSGFRSKMMMMTPH